MDADPAAAVTPAQPSRRPIGEFLVERGLVTPDELAAALAQQRLSGQRLGEILVERGSISRMSLASVLGEQWEEAGRHLRAVVPVRLADGKEAEGGLAGGQELHESLASLQQAVARLEDLAGDADGERPVSAESSVAADVLVRLERLEAELRDGSLGEQFTAGIEALRTDLAQVRAALAKPVTADEALMLRLGRIEESLQDRATDGVEQRLVALDEWLRGREDDDALGESVTEALDRLRARLDGLESSVAAPVERLGRLELLLSERDERPQEPGVEAALAELRTGLDELRAVVERAPADDEALAARFDRLETVLASQRDDASEADPNPELLGRFDRIDAALARDDSAEPAWVDELRGAVSGPPARDEELHERLGRMEASLAEPRNDEVGAELERLRAAVEHRPGPDHGVHERLDRIDARLAESALPEPFEVPPRRDDELHERLGRIEAALAGLDPSGSFTAAVHELRETIAHAPQPDASILERLDQLGAALGDRSVGEFGGELAARLDRIEAALEVTRERAPEQRDDELHERLARIEARFTDDDGTETTAALSALADRMVELRAAVERPDESAAALHERLDALEAALGDSRADGFSERLHGIAAALDEVRDLQRRPTEPDADLYASLERIETLAAAHVSREPLEDVQPSGPDAREIVGHVREAVAERLDGIEHSLREAIAAAVPNSPDAGEIAGRVHEAMTQRFDAVEQSVRDAIADASPGVPDAGEIAGRVQDAVAGRLDAVEHSLREAIADAAPAVPEAGEIAGRVHDALAGRLSRLESAMRERPESEALGELSARLDDIRSTLDHDRGAELAAQLERLQDELRGELAGTRERVERLDSDVLGRVGELLDRLGGLDEVRDGLARVEQAAADHASAGQVERIEVLTADLRAALADPPGAAALSRLVSQSHNALADRIASFEQALEGRPDEPAPIPEERSETSFMAMVPTSEGYRLVSVDGLLPHPGATFAIEGEARMLEVARLGPSPIPGDRRRCVYLQRV